MARKYPEGVVDKVAYDKWIELKKHECFADHNRYETSDEDDNLIVDCHGLSSYIEGQIAHLSEKERSRIMQKAKLIHSFRGKATSWKNKAFGINHRSYSAVADGKNYLLAERASDIIELLGTFHSIEHTHKVITMEWGLPVSYHTVQAFNIRHRAKIKERQDEYQRDFSDIALIHKKTRLHELSSLYYHRKEIYEKTKSQGDYKLLMATLKQIKDEVEGNTLTIEANINADIQQTINLQLEKELSQKTNILQLVLARVAARANVNPLYLLTKLQKSVYNRFNGFGNDGIQELEDGEEMKYPTALIYNMDNIKKNADELYRKEQDLRKFPQISETKKQKALSAKEKLLQMIKKDQDMYKDSDESQQE